MFNDQGVEVLHEGANGEIHIRGPSVMNEYLNNTLATTEIIEDGWLKTGDIGYVAKGKIYVIDRIKVSTYINQ